MIQNMWPGDLALVELLRNGKTDAPAEIIGELYNRGLTTKGGAALTNRGRARAEACKAIEADLRTMFAAAADGKPAITAPGGCSMHLPGGKVSIR